MSLLNKLDKTPKMNTLFIVLIMLFNTFTAGVLDRRRNAPRFESPVFKRRARTQALRRNKLNNQSLKSHLQHSQKMDDASSKQMQT